MMRAILFLLLLITLPISANEQEDCREGNTYEMRECEFRRLKAADQKLKKKLKPKTFEDWVSIRTTMCRETYEQYKEGTIYPLVVMRCSIDMNNKLLEKTNGLN